jgi:hypothetical protein
VAFDIFANFIGGNGVTVTLTNVDDIETTATNPSQLDAGALSTRTFDTANALTDLGLSSSLRCTTAATVTTSGYRWLGGIAGSCSAGQPRKDWRCYIRMSAIPANGAANAFQPILLTDSAGTFIGAVRIQSTSGVAKILIFNGAITVSAQCSSSLVAGVWYRLEGYIVHAAASGELNLKLFAVYTDTTPLAGDSVTINAAGVNTVQAGGNMQFAPGCERSLATQDMKFTGIRINDSGSPIGPIPPAGPAFSYWNGASEVPGTLSYWDGATEVPVVSAAVV